MATIVTRTNRFLLKNPLTSHFFRCGDSECKGSWDDVVPSPALWVDSLKVWHTIFTMTAPVHRAELQNLPPGANSPVKQVIFQHATPSVWWRKKGSQMEAKRNLWGVSSVSVAWKCLLFFIFSPLLVGMRYTCRAGLTTSQEQCSSSQKKKTIWKKGTCAQKELTDLDPKHRRLFIYLW